MIKEEEYLDIYEKYGSECYVFDLESLKDRIEKIKDIVNNRYHLCYSIKANPFLIPFMEKHIDTLEVCSPGEFEICARLSVSPDKILYSGVNKRDKDIKEAMEYGVGTFTAESLKHVRLIQEEALLENKTVNVLPRLSTGSQFGMSKEDLLSVVDHQDQYPNICLKGIHYFAGTERKKPSKQVKELEQLKELYKELKEEYGWNPERLEYGPGLSVPMFVKDDYSDTVKPLKDIHEELCSFGDTAEVTIEMGRFFAAECGHYISKVMDLKENAGMHYCIIDAGINHITYYGSMMGMNSPVIQHIHQTEDREKKTWCICGSLCSFNDVLVREYEAEGLSENDLLIFDHIGAYSVTEGIYLFLSREMPKILIKDEDGMIKEVRGSYDTGLLNTPKSV